MSTELSESDRDELRSNGIRLCEIDRRVRDLKVEIKRLQGIVKELNTERGGIEETIAPIMSNSDLANVQMLSEDKPNAQPNELDVLKLKESTRLVPVKTGDVLEKTVKFFQSDSAGAEFTNSTPEEKGRILHEYVHGPEGREKVTKHVVKTRLAASAE